MANTYGSKAIDSPARQFSCSVGTSMSRIPSGRRKTPDTSPVAHRCRCRKTLRSVQSELEELREQNRILTESARFFAELSERLNVRLRRQIAQAQLDDILTPNPVRSTAESLAVACPKPEAESRARRKASSA